MPTSSVPAEILAAPESADDGERARVYLVGGTAELVEAVAPVVAPLGPDRVIDLAAPELTIQDVLEQISDLHEPTVVVVLPSLRFDPAADLPADLILQRNLKFPFFAIQHFARGMFRSGGGTIVNVAERPPATSAAAAPYAAAAAGLVSLTRVLAVEWAEHGVRANAVIMEGHEEGYAQLARTVAFFAGSGTTYVTGQSVAVHAEGNTATI